jgi:acetaldehyde dehydrogenase (acetylating)
VHQSVGVGSSHAALPQAELCDEVAYRAAGPAERARLDAERKAASEARLAELAHGMRAAFGKPDALTTPNSYPSSPLMLAAKARALMTQNDPDAVRAGLAEIADALDALSRGGTAATG